MSEILVVTSAYARPPVLFFEFEVNPLNPKIKIWILINSSCVIRSVILMTTLFYKALILQGEIWCWSLLGLKGLKNSVGYGSESQTLTLRFVLTQNERVKSY